MKMDEFARRTLRRERKYILDVRVDDIEAMLIAKGLFTPDMMQEIKAETSDRKKTGKMLDMLETRGPDAFGIFCDILGESNSWVKKRLEQTYEEECKRGEENINFDWLDDLLPSRRQAQVTDAELSIISTKMGNEWEHLAKLMGFSAGEIDHFRAANPHSFYQQVSKMLSSWKARNGSQATVENLVKKMREAEVGDDVYRRVLVKDTQ